MPTTGPVQQGEEVEVSGADTFVRVIARPPTEGLSPVDVVRGFLASQSSRENNFAVARQYLTPDAAASWNPAGGIEVFDGAGSFDQIAPTDVSFFAPTYLLIDDSGRPSVPTATTFSVFDFRVEQIDGQWRVNNPPTGLLISRGDLTRSYRGYALWFPDPTGEVLVPDTTVLPLATGAIATSLTQGLLLGPSKWLAPAVRSAFPVNTSLSLDAVTVEDGVARVPLSSAVLSASERDRKLLAAQLGKTLSAITGVSSVEVVVGAQLLQLGDWGESIETSEWAQFQASPPEGDASAIAREKPVVISDGVVRAPTEPLGFAGAKLSAVAPSFDSTVYAGVSTDRQQLLLGRPGTPRPLRLDFDQLLSSPRFDRFGWVWVVGARGVWAINSGASNPEPKLVGGLPAEVLVSSVVPSIDGVRVLLRAQSETASFVALAAIRRGEELELTGLHRIDRDLGSVISTGWADANRIVALRETGLDREAVSFDLLSGQTISLGAPPSSSTLGASVGRSILIGSDANEIFQQSSSGWQPVGAATAPIYPG